MPDFDKRDEKFLEQLRPLLRFFYEHYFRVEVYQTERIPKRPVLFVGNHNGVMGSEVLMLLEVARRYFPSEQKNILGLTHSFALNEPIFKWLPKIGCVHAKEEIALEAFAANYSLMVYPGGDRDTFRTWWNRDKVDFSGRKGYAELALKANVPIVPIVNVGGHEQSFIFHRSDWLAKKFNLKEKYRITSVPLTPSSLFLLPGLFIEPIQDISFKTMIGVSSLPLPAKMEFYFEDPIELSSREKKLSFEEQVILLDERTREALGRSLKKGYSEKRIPILGKVYSSKKRKNDA